MTKNAIGLRLFAKPTFITNLVATLWPATIVPVYWLVAAANSGNNVLTCQSRGFDTSVEPNFMWCYTGKVN